MRTMQIFRRIALALGGIMFVGLGLIWWLAVDSRDGARIMVSFIGFTNQSREVTTVSPHPRKGTINIVAAVLLVTNRGPAAVTILASTRASVFQVQSNGTLKAPEGFASPESRGLPRLLKPGESTLVLARTGVRDGPWWTEFSYQRSSLWDRMYSWLLTVTSASIERPLLRLYDPFKLNGVTYEHPTNAPLGGMLIHRRRDSVQSIEWTPPAEINLTPSGRRPSPSLFDGGVYW